MKINYLEVCTGAGGLSLGFEKAAEELGVESTHTCVEILKPQCETLRHNRPEWKVLQEDMTKCHDEESTAKFMEEHDISEIDILAGGIPCQSFSLAGLRKGLDDPRGQLFFNFRYMAKHLKPKILLIENVKNLVSIDKGEPFKLFLNCIKDLGYVPYWKVLNSNNFGVAQARERVIIVGVREDIHTQDFTYPEPLDQKPVLRDILEDINNNVNTGESTPPGPGTVFGKLFEDFFSKAYTEDNIGEKVKINYGHKNIIKLGLDLPSNTLTTRPVGSFFTYMHWSEKRKLNVKEYASIQSFPPEYEFKGTTNQKYHQIGNAVPVKLGYHIYKSVLNYLKNVTAEN